MSKLNNILSWDYFYIYLSGAIDFARDTGTEWREKWTKELMDIGFKRRQIFNPCKKPLEGAPFNVDNEGQICKTLRQNKDYSGLCNTMKKIAHIDLRLVDLSSLVLVNFPKKGQKQFQDIVEKFEKAYDNVIYQPETADEMKEAFYELLTLAAASQTPTYGTTHEIVEARRQKKPVFIVWEGGKQECSGWLMWLVGEGNVFGSFEEMKAKLLDILSGKDEYDSEDWLLLNIDKHAN